jgi:hypothetical protein
LSAWEKERWLKIGDEIKKKTIELNDALKSGLFRRKGSHGRIQEVQGGAPPFRPKVPFL